MTTAHGGFYINCGALEFRAADRHSLVHNNNNNNNSDEDESSESSEEDTEDVDSPKRTGKQTLSSSDDDEMEDITGDNPRKVIETYIRHILAIYCYVTPNNGNDMFCRGKLRRAVTRKVITKTAKRGKSRKIIKRRINSSKMFNQI